MVQLTTRRFNMKKMIQWQNECLIICETYEDCLDQ